MSNLTNNTAKLEALLTQINELPSAGGGGSGDNTIETCTIIIINETESDQTTNIGATILNDEGKVTSYLTSAFINYFEDEFNTNKVTIQNVLCNSTIHLSFVNYSIEFIVHTHVGLYEEGFPDNYYMEFDGCGYAFEIMVPPTSGTYTIRIKTGSD